MGVASRAGYSGTPLERKLGVRPGHVVLLDGPPEGFVLDVPGASIVHRLPPRIDVAVTFHLTRDSLAARLPLLVERLVAAGSVWACWPKKSAQRAQGIVSDLSEDVVRDLALALGIVDVKVAAVDDTWSGLKLVRRLADR